jgi:hypothetical protein
MPRRDEDVKRSYWLDLFTAVTWDQFLKHGGNISGFRESRWNTVKKMAKGDYLLCYLTGVSRFIGILEVTSAAFKKEDRDIWIDESFPCRLGVKQIVELTPETAVPVLELRNQLTYFQNLKSPHAWSGYFRSSPAKMNQADGEAVVKALLEAKENPITRPFDQRKLKYRPKVLRAEIGSVTVPEANDEEGKTDIKEESAASEHTEIQWHLLKLGADMGFDVWVARNDRKREFKGRKFSDLPSLKASLPLQFDEAVNKTIELIDVLWLRGNAIVAAFEIESTTLIYSGLLRMSDLIAMQPNLTIPLYLVAPDDRRDKVMTEVNRPTFSRLAPPLSQMCRFISFSGLKDQIKQAAAYIRFLRPEFLEELSESCELEEA